MKHMTSFRYNISFSNTFLFGKEENFPSPIRIKQLKACWIKIIKSLKEMLAYCDTISVKKRELYLKLIELDLVGSTEDVEESHLILN